MRRIPLLLVIAQAALVASFAVALRSGRLPLGVAGEWEWQRIRVAPTFWPVASALSCVAGFAGFVALGYRSLARGKAGSAGWLAGLVVAGVLVQGAAQEGAPEGYGLSKWIMALSAPGSSGYYTVARSQMANPRRFLADYPAWIARQDALHVGTHPPGLFLVARGMLDLMHASPATTRAVLALAPASVTGAARALREAAGLPRLDAAALALTGALTLLACSLTVVPLYLLARSTHPAPAAWVAASLWPLAPSALLFQPTADTAFPLLSTTALALAAWSARSRGVMPWLLAAGSGTILAVGMTFTLAFLAVGLVVALILLFHREIGWPRRLALIAATGGGFLLLTLAWWAATSANPFAIWWTNQQNHARFYVEYPRSYRAWLVANPIELAIGLGLPASTWIFQGFATRSSIPRVAWLTLLVLAALTLTGRSLSEVGRLWLPLMPPLLVAAGAASDRLRASPWTLAAAVALSGLQVLILEATIQVVYPV